MFKKFSGDVDRIAYDDFDYYDDDDDFANDD